MNIYVKNLKQSDAEPLFQFETENRAYFETLVPSRGDKYYQYDHFQLVLTELLKEQAEGLSFFYLIKDECEKIIGRVNLVDIDKANKSGSVGYRIGKASINNGIATQALKLLLLETGKLDVREIHAKTTPNNIGSQKVLVNNGFKPFLEIDEPDFVHFIWRA